MHTVITPVIKDNKGGVSSLDNYKPLTGTCVCSKLLEIILLNHCNDKLYTKGNQLGFKCNHPTDKVIFTLTQVTEYHLAQESPCYIWFLDASKAFDQINHTTLFNELAIRIINALFIRFMNFWYKYQVLFCKME